MVNGHIAGDVDGCYLAILPHTTLFTHFYCMMRTLGAIDFLSDPFPRGTKLGLYPVHRCARSLHF